MRRVSILCLFLLAGCLNFYPRTQLVIPGKGPGPSVYFGGVFNGREVLATGEVRSRGVSSSGVMTVFSEQLTPDLYDELYAMALAGTQGHQPLTNEMIAECGQEGQFWPRTTAHIEFYDGTGLAREVVDCVGTEVHRTMQAMFAELQRARAAEERG